MLRYDYGKGDLKNWLIAEENFDLLHQGKCEAIFCLGNGYLGQRAALEEAYVGQTRDLLICGTFNRFDEEEVTELPNAADVTNLELRLDGSRFAMDSGKLIQYRRVMNLRTGELTREVEWESPAGRRYLLNFSRFVSMAQEHLLGQRVRVTPLDGDCVLRMDSGINGQVTNTGTQHFHEGKKRIFDNTILRMSQQTTESGVTVCFHTAHRYALDGSPAEGKLLPVLDRRAMSIRGTFTVPAGSTFTIEKLTVICTSRDAAYASFSAEEAAARAEESGTGLLRAALTESYDALLSQSAQAWNAVWQAQDIEIRSGRDFDQLLIRFAIYHLNIMRNRNDNRVGIAAKGLTGEGYKGHSFWDTEIFILPYFLLTDPESARRLLEYRYLGLAGARSKARENGYAGAMYPWEAAWTDDGEVTPLWGAADIVTGKPIPILTGIMEQHITADVAFSVWQYYTATGDRSFMDACGWEMLLDTGRFWASRAEWMPEHARYEINHVIGPDEYKDDVNNNAYTNYMAAYNMKLALQALDLLEAEENSAAARLKKQFDFSALRAEIRKVLDGLYLPCPGTDGIIPQFDGYFDLKHIDLTPYRKAGSPGTIYNDYNQEQICTFQVHKQADTVVLLLLLEDLFAPEIRKKNYAYYETRTLHDSSLSKSTHCVLAADLGDSKAAVRFFEGCGEIDLGPNMASSNAGIHTASMGGIWQCVVYGFGGTRIVGNHLRIEPKLPDGWTGLSFPLVWRGQPLRVTAEPNSLRIRNAGTEAVELLCRGAFVEIPAGRETVIP